MAGVLCHVPELPMGDASTSLLAASKDKGSRSPVRRRDTVFGDGIAPGAGHTTGERGCSEFGVGAVPASA